MIILFRKYFILPLLLFVSFQNEITAQHLMKDSRNILRILSDPPKTNFSQIVDIKFDYQDGKVVVDEKLTYLYNKGVLQKKFVETIDYRIRNEYSYWRGKLLTINVAKWEGQLDQKVTKQKHSLIYDKKRRLKAIEVEEKGAGIPRVYEYEYDEDLLVSITESSPMKEGGFVETLSYPENSSGLIFSQLTSMEDFSQIVTPVFLKINTNHPQMKFNDQFDLIEFSFSDETKDVVYSIEYIYGRYEMWEHMIIYKSVNKKKKERIRAINRTYIF